MLEDPQQVEEEMIYTTEQDGGQVLMGSHGWLSQCQVKQSYFFLALQVSGVLLVSRPGWRAGPWKHE